jgi:hypothetical protein
VDRGGLALPSRRAAVADAARARLPKTVGVGIQLAAAAGDDAGLIFNGDAPPWQSAQPRQADDGRAGPVRRPKQLSVVGCQNSDSRDS